MADKPYITIRSADGYRLAWLSDEPPPENQQDGALGEHLDTGNRFIYYRGDWHQQAFSTDLWVSLLTRVPYGATSGALDANDAMGDKIYFNRSVDGRPMPRYGRLLTARLIDQSDVVLAATLNISTKDFTAAASDGAFTIGLNDAQYFLNSQTFPAGVDLGSAKVSVVTDINEDFYADEGRLVAQLSTTGTPTPTAGAMPLVQIFVLPLG